MSALCRIASLVPVALCWCLASAAPVAADGLQPRPQNVRVAHEEVDVNPVIGPRYAPVTMDFFLSLSVAQRLNLRAYQRLLALAERHPQRLRVVIRLLDNRGVTKLSEAVLEAHAQGRFFALMDKLSIGRRSHVPHTDKQIKALCERVGVDFPAVEAAWEDRRHQPTLEDNDRYRRSRRARSNPLGLLVNGKQVRLPSSSITVSKLEEVYDLAYAKAKVMLDRGVALEHVYELALLAEDASLEPVRVNAGRINGQGRRRAAVLYDAPLVAPAALTGGHLVGNENAPVTIHLYCDFAHHYRACGDTKKALDAVLTHYSGGVRLYFHHLLPEEMSDTRRTEAKNTHAAGLCAAAQDKFEAFFDSAYGRSFRLRRRRIQRRSYGEWMSKLIDKIKLDKAVYEACMADPATDEKLQELIRAGRAAGITKSPTVIVGDRMYTGSKTSDDIIRLVDIELMPGLLEQLVPGRERHREWYPNVRR